jgi:cytidylate kinase
MAVVTISREYGSAGSVVARQAAEILGYHLVDKAAIGRILAGYGLIDFERAYESESGVWSAFDSRVRTIVSMLERVAFAVARHGHSVILGRGSYVLLAGTPGVLNVRIRAPFDWRVNRTMEEEGLGDRSAAEALVREGDKVRSSFVSAMYGLRWDSMERFDLVLDTSRIGAAKAASWIAEAARILQPEETAPRAGELERPGREPDPTLDEAVATELGCQGRLAGEERQPRRAKV